MSKYKLWLMMGCIGLLLISTNAMSATRYVSDQLSVNVRRGPSTSYGITQMIKSGTRLETLGESQGWSHIRTADGEEGYVLTRFLSHQPAARDRIDAIKAKLDKLEKENESLHGELSQALNGSDKLGQLKKELVARNTSLKQKLSHLESVSGNAIQLKQDNESLHKQVLDAKSEVERLQSKNKALKSRRKGMKMGALILFGGIIVGLVLPMLRRRKKNNWGSL